LPGAKKRDGLSGNRSARQEPDARSTRAPLLTSVFANKQQVRQRLAIKHELRTEKKKKSIMRAEDEFELLKTLYLSTEMNFNHERHRVQLASIMHLAGITGNRPAAFLAVCYEHVKVTLLPDPRGERPRVLVKIAYKYTKGYLGEKDS